MTFDASFWVTVSFMIFIGLLFYFKIPVKVKSLLDESILNIKKQILEAEKLKEDAKNILTNLDKSGKIEINKIKNSIIKPWFIPETTKVKDQLNEFINRKEKLAFVVDEYGELMGLISLEDIIEEIVGNIFDEKDSSTIGIRRINDDQYRIRGDVNIRDINRELDLNLPENNASTLAGYIIYKTEALPEVGQTFKFNNIVYEIINKNKNQITQIKVFLDRST